MPIYRAVRLALFLRKRNKQYFDPQLATHVEAIISHAKALHRLMVAECNRPLSPAQQTRMLNLEGTIDALLEPYGCTLTHQGGLNLYATPTGKDESTEGCLVCV